ncbi:histidine kinase [Phenylobacterium sp.]|uniref:sensor histidine kinase n=1 Tax=Phenylobacterium sp. TaxID=1871053 RepID=UPI00286C9653|nr:histidine kinase [Phenylobacterium sp.]
MTIAFGQPDEPRRAGARPWLDRYLVANLTLWLFTYLLITVRSLGMGSPLPTVIAMSARRGVVCAAAFGLCVLFQRLLLSSRAWPRSRRLLLAAGLSILGGAFYTLLNQLVFYAIAPVAPFDGSPLERAYALMLNFSVLIWSFIAWCAVVFALDYDQQAREQSLRLVEAQALAAESQNQMLRYQINPHFMFNTLNALSSLILQKDFDRAERMVLSLSSFLRASLDKTPGDKVALADELAAQRQYLAIEQVRFGDRLRLRETAPASLLDALVPGLILQPLVENAVKYGVARTLRPVVVEIAAQARGDRLVLTVRDDAAPDLADAAVTLGVGLSNVRRRLAVLYGDAGVLTCGPNPGGGFLATVELPLERRR